MAALVAIVLRLNRMVRNISNPTEGCFSAQGTLDENGLICDRVSFSCMWSLAGSKRCRE